MQLYLISVLMYMLVPVYAALFIFVKICSLLYLI